MQRFGLFDHFPYTKVFGFLTQFYSESIEQFQEVLNWYYSFGCDGFECQFHICRVGLGCLLPLFFAMPRFEERDRSLENGLHHLSAGLILLITVDVFVGTVLDYVACKEVSFLPLQREGGFLQHPLHFPHSHIFFMGVVEFGFCFIDGQVSTYETVLQQLANGSNLKGSYFSALYCVGSVSFSCCLRVLSQIIRESSHNRSILDKDTSFRVINWVLAFYLLHILLDLGMQLGLLFLLNGFLPILLDIQWLPMAYQSGHESYLLLQLLNLNILLKQYLFILLLLKDCLLFCLSKQSVSFSLRLAFLSLQLLSNPAFTLLKDIFFSLESLRYFPSMCLIVVFLNEYPLQELYFEVLFFECFPVLGEIFPGRGVSFA